MRASPAVSSMRLWVDSDQCNSPRDKDQAQTLVHDRDVRTQHCAVYESSAGQPHAYGDFDTIRVGPIYRSEHSKSLMDEGTKTVQPV
jgi:hypothetical protein